MKILIIGGNRFFGKRLARNLSMNHEVTLMNRGSLDDGLGERVKRIVCDRTNQEELRSCIRGLSWDLVFDQACFDYPQAVSACEVFKGKVARYIFTSSVSVYEYGSDIKENTFDPHKHQFKEIVTTHNDYAEAKRQAECGFLRKASFPVVSIRFPIVIGQDDYTGRLKFHVDRIRLGKEIFFSNLDARMSFIEAGFAAHALEKLGESDFIGAINVANPEAMKLKDLISLIEEHTGKELVNATEKTDKTISPYNISQDWYINTQQLLGIGLTGENTSKFIQKLLKESF